MLSDLSRLRNTIIRLLGLKQRRAAYELDFLPAALEILERGASPVGSLVAWSICGIIAASGIWAAFSKLDITVSASGVVIPEGRTQVVQPSQQGVIQRILVRDGDRVSAGQPVLLIDPTDDAAGENKALGELIQARLDVSGLSALEDSVAGSNQLISIPKVNGANPADLLREQTVIEGRWHEYLDKQRDLEAQADGKRAELDEDAAEVHKLEADLPLLAGSRSMYRKLWAQQLCSRINLLDSEQKYSDAENDLRVRIIHAGQIRALLVSVNQQQKADRADFVHSVGQDLIDAEQRLISRQAGYQTASHALAHQTLRASISGTVQQLSVHTVGGVVHAGDTLLAIVPNGEVLLANVAVRNRDVGFVHEGQNVTLKVAAFDYTRYGVLHGQVINLAHDARNGIEKDPVVTTEGLSFGNNANDSKGEDGQKQYYNAQISINRGEFFVDGRYESIIPGMDVTAVIRSGRQTILSYLLSPMVKVFSQSGHER